MPFAIRLFIPMVQTDAKRLQSIKLKDLSLVAFGMPVEFSRQLN